MRINNNIAAMNAHKNLSISGGKKQKSTEKLSSGLRINRSADDAAGLAISEKMRAQIRGLNQASRNIGDGISLVQTAEGGMQEIHNIMQRGRELLIQALNDSNDSDVDRPAIQAELDQLTAEIDDMANKTVFNDINLLNGGGDEGSAKARAASAELSRMSSAIEGVAQRGLDIETFAALTPPVLSAVYNVDKDKKTITVTTNGKLDLSSDALLAEVGAGDISGYTVQVNGENVLLSQSDAASPLNNVTINCSADTNLFVNGLNILQTEDKSAIKFSSGDNTLNLMGTNTFVQDASDVPNYSGEEFAGISDALIRIDAPAGLEIKNAAGSDGVLNASFEPNGSRRLDVYGAVIGASGNAPNAIPGGNLTISSGSIMAKTSGECVNHLGSVIGASCYSGFGDITITGGTVVSEYDTVGVAIGVSGAAIGGSGAGDINISGGEVRASIRMSFHFGAAIGAGCNSITVSGGKVWAESEGAWGSVIGEGCNTITLSGGEISVTKVNNGFVLGAAIGGANDGKEGSDLILSGGILHVNGSHIGGGNLKW